MILKFFIVSLWQGSSFTPSELKPLLTIFQRRLTARVNDFNEVSLVHVLWLLSSHCVLEEDLTQRVYDRVLDSVSSLRVCIINSILNFMLLQQNCNF